MTPAQYAFIEYHAEHDAAEATRQTKDLAHAIALVSQGGEGAAAVRAWAQDLPLPDPQATLSEGEKTARLLEDRYFERRPGVDEETMAETRRREEARRHGQR